MFSISDWLYGFLGDSGEMGLVLFIFLIFFIDALIFPTLPELFFVTSYMYSENLSAGQSLVFGTELLAAAIIAEILGVTLLYFLVGRIKIPQRIERVVNKYVGFLVFGDERLLLVNRIAPMIPFCGAFIKVAGWDIKRSLIYIIVGCLVKYGVILIMSDFFMSYFSSSDAQLYTLIFIIAVIVVSFALSVLFKKKNDIPT